MTDVSVYIIQSKAIRIVTTWLQRGKGILYEKKGERIKRVGIDKAGERMGEMKIRWAKYLK